MLVIDMYKIVKSTIEFMGVFYIKKTNSQSAYKNLFSTRRTYHPDQILDSVRYDALQAKHREEDILLKHHC